MRNGWIHADTAGLFVRFMAVEPVYFGSSEGGYGFDRSQKPGTLRAATQTILYCLYLSAIPA